MQASLRARSRELAVISTKRAAQRRVVRRVRQARLAEAGSPSTLRDVAALVGDPTPTSDLQLRGDLAFLYSAISPARRPRTWAGHAAIWRDALEYIRPRMRARRLPLTLRSLVDNPSVVYGYVSHVAQTSTAVAAVKRACEAINFVLGSRGLRRVCNDDMMSMLKQATKRARSMPRQPMAPLTRVESDAIASRWGGGDVPIWQNAVALFMLKSRATLARFSDAALFQVDGTVFTAGGADSVIAFRKNAQDGTGHWAPQSTRNSRALDIERRYLTRMGFQVPASGVVANPHGYYLLPTLTRVGGHNHPRRIQFDCRLRRVPLGHGGDRSQCDT